MTGRVIPFGRGHQPPFGQGVGAADEDLPPGVVHSQNNRPDQAGAPLPQVSDPRALGMLLNHLLENTRIAGSRLLGIPPNSIKASILDGLWKTYTTIQENIGTVSARLQSAKNQATILEIQKDTDAVAKQVQTFIQTVEEYCQKYGSSTSLQGLGGVGATTTAAWYTNKWLWLLWGLLLIGGGYYFYKRSKKRRMRLIKLKD